MTHVQSARPTYQDLPSDIDYQASLHTLMQAEEAFNALPAKVRDHFANDPAAFLAAFSDPKQEQYLRDHGFLKPAEAPRDASGIPLPANDGTASTSAPVSS